MVPYTPLYWVFISVGKKLKLACVTNAKNFFKNLQTPIAAKTLNIKMTTKVHETLRIVIQRLTRVNLLILNIIYVPSLFQTLRSLEDYACPSMQMRDQ